MPIRLIQRLKELSERTVAGNRKYDAVLAAEEKLSIIEHYPCGLARTWAARSGDAALAKALDPCV